MTLRLKSLLAYFVICFVPLLLLASLNYWNGVSGVDAYLRPDLQDKLNALAIDVDLRLEEHENAIRRLAQSKSLTDFLTTPSTTELLSAVKAELAQPLNRGFSSITLFDQNRRLALLARQDLSGSISVSTNVLEATIPNISEVLVTKDFQVTVKDGRLHIIVPVGNQLQSAVSGFLVGQLDLSPFLANSARLIEKNATLGSIPASFVVVLDGSKGILYHTDHSLEGKSTDAAFPLFESMAQPELVNRGGVGHFAAATGGDYLVTYGPIPRRNLIVAVAKNRAPFISTARRWGLAGFILAFVAALIAAKILESYVQRRSKGLIHITENVSAIAKGEIDRRIELKSSDDARVLADNINVVIERLREQIAREEETRQFNSFVRLSAMLTHDLKNAIEALSLIVGNMERHFDNEQFRADAMKSLTGATDKLKAIVNRLTKPLTSLSGEHPRPREVDLIPILNRVMAMTAEPMRGKHSIEIKLPQTLTAMVEGPRIEEVVENLVINALEAMGDKSGKLTIEAGRAANGAAVLTVSDTGPGISPDFVKNQLFRPFATTKKTGVGLGLYTCREVIKANAGTIEVESEEGAGTTFRVVLPSTSYDRRN